MIAPILAGTILLVLVVDVFLPAVVNNQPTVQLRVLTTNAVGNDEFVGVDDIAFLQYTGGTTGLAKGAAIERTFDERFGSLTAGGSSTATGASTTRRTSSSGRGT